MNSQYQTLRTSDGMYTVVVDTKAPILKDEYYFDPTDRTITMHLYSFRMTDLKEHKPEMQKIIGHLPIPVDYPELEGVPLLREKSAKLDMVAFDANNFAKATVSPEFKPGSLSDAYYDVSFNARVAGYMAGHASAQSKGVYTREDMRGLMNVMLTWTTVNRRRIYGQKFTQHIEDQFNHYLASLDESAQVYEVEMTSCQVMCRNLVCPHIECEEPDKRVPRITEEGGKRYLEGRWINKQEKQG